jgi:DNA-binding CsgD family transcriptional regulator
MAEPDLIVKGREAFDRLRWGESYALFAAADEASRLKVADLERFAAAACLVGEDRHARTIWSRMHHELVDEGHVERAAQCGFWLSIHLLLAGEVAQATGWLARSNRLLKERKRACVARGYACVVSGLLAMGKGDPEGACTEFAQAIALADRFGDSDLLALGLLGEGQSLILSGAVAEGASRLDETMVMVTAWEVSPVLTGIIYCAVILTCQRVFDLRRAKEWTQQFDGWCAAQPDLVPYKGQCLVHRSEILQLQGDWSGAFAEITHARTHLAESSEAVVGRACYQKGELHRLRGEYEQAEDMYHEARVNGCEPQPGLSLLRLASGQHESAAAAIRSWIEPAESGQNSAGGPPRARLLGPFVEILLAAGDVVAARAAADELASIAAEIDAPFLMAVSTQATGMVLLKEGKAKAALALLRESWALWQQFEAPYESARVQVLIGRVCKELGDEENARMHFDAAQTTFDKLGAAPDMAELQAHLGGETAAAGALTPREREVLALLATGQTNRQIAADLAISEHTVGRHVSNIFDKLGVTSRAAATGFAYEHNLL